MVESSENKAGAHMLGVEADIESDCDTVNVDTSDSSSLRSLFETLRALLPSALARNRRLRSNLPSWIKKGKGAAKSKGISPSDCMKEFGNEKLVVSNKKLFCSACHKEISTKKGSIEGHTKSRKHATARKL